MTALEVLISVVLVAFILMIHRRDVCGDAAGVGNPRLVYPGARLARDVASTPVAVPREVTALSAPTG
jgi:hypothetical protein